MKRSMIAMVVAGTALAVLLTGCGNGQGRGGRADTPKARTSTSVDTGTAAAASGDNAAGTAPAVDASLDAVDRLLNELDEQVDTDNRAAEDAD